MAKKIIINGNYLMVTDTVSSGVEFEAPTRRVRYVREDGGITLYADGSRSSQRVLRAQTDAFEDAFGVGIVNIYDWLQIVILIILLFKQTKESPR
jgi:hypothetical protein